MKMPRERKSLFERKENIEAPLKIYGLIMEGSQTEEDYFEGIILNKKKLGIKEKIKLHKIPKKPLIRGENDSHCSHMLKQAIEYKEKNDYENEEVVFVLDRDQQNFKEDQYDEFLKICSENGYNICMSNPTFELWLLMHFDMKLDSEYIKKIKENRKISRSNRAPRFLAAEVALKLERSHRKKNVPFEKVINGVEQAIKNSQKFPDDLITLKNETGTTIGKFFEKLLK
ncbi:MAG: RloB family protein [Cetobacterium sp.]